MNYDDFSLEEIMQDILIDSLHTCATISNNNHDLQQHTVSPSMDIQVASNFERLIFDAYSNDSDKVLKLMGIIQSAGYERVALVAKLPNES